MENIATHVEYFLGNYLTGYHIPSIKELSLSDLNKLYVKNPLITLSKKETLAKIKELLTQPITTNKSVIIDMVI